MTQTWSAGDWVVFDLKVGQIKELRDGGESFSDGWFETSGRLADRFRPLTLQNKRIAEHFEITYRRLSEIDGNSGFNYPGISQYFCELALQAMDQNNDSKEPYDKAAQFIQDARGYKAEIDGVPLFRPQPVRLRS